jgi:hypothetical protein
MLCQASLGGMAHWTRRTTGVSMAKMRATQEVGQREAFMGFKKMKVMTLMQRCDFTQRLTMLTGVWSKGKKTARQNPVITSHLS